MGGDREDEEPTDADRDPPDDAASESADDAEPVALETDADRETDSEASTPGDPSAEAADGADSVYDVDELAGADGTAESPEEGPETLEDVAGIGEAKADALREAGYESVADLRAASEDDLVEVSGIGETLSARIKDDVGEPRADQPAVEADDEVGGGVDAGSDFEDPYAEKPEIDPVGPDPEVRHDDEPFLSGPESDEEMPLTAHIEEMIKRLAIVVAIAGIVSVVTFPFAERIINFLWYNILPGVPSEIARPRLYGVLELVFTKLKVASLAGLIVALPALVYETYQFMRPGLYPHERRYYLAAIPASLVLALVGVSFAYFIVLPAIFTYFLAYSQDVATIGFALGRTFNLILVLMGYLALVFQIPLFIMLAMMMGIVTRRWLANRRLLFWGAFLGVSFLFSPDPTGMAPVIIALTMVGLFEGTLLLTKWAGRE